MADEFETRVRDALDTGAAGAPRAGGLADAARARAHSRRRTRLGVLAAVTLTAVAVPLGLAVVDGSAGLADDPSRLPEPGPGGGEVRLPSGWHTESWRDAEVQVPNTWGYGRLSSWCEGSAIAPAPVVERPDQLADGSCEPALGYGVQFVPTEDAPDLDSSQPRRYRPSEGPPLYPEDAWVGVACAECPVAVLVVSPSEYVARYLLGSVRRFQGLDSNGCLPQVDGDPERRPPGEGVSVCRYDAEGWLVQSEQLTGADATDASAALSAAAAAGLPDPDSEQCPESAVTKPSSELLVHWSGGTTRVVLESSCGSVNGLYEGEARIGALTSEVVYWVVSPGWTARLPAEVPLPGEPRDRFAWSTAAPS